MQRLDHLKQHGPTPLAFTFEQQFTVEEMLAIASEPNFQQHVIRSKG